MPQQILGTVNRPIEITCHRPTQIPDSDLKRHSCCAFVGSREIVGYPGYVLWEGGVDAAGCYEDSGVDYAGDFAGGGAANGEDETD